MKLCTFIEGGAVHVGVLTKRGVADITAIGFPDSMNEIILGGGDMRRRISEAVSGNFLPVFAESELTFGNVCAPSKIICEGLNYTDHAEETGVAPPEYPVFFSKFNDALQPANRAVELPKWQNCFDYEAELVIVIGHEAYNISEEDAGSYIFGYTCGNDLSARDAQFLSGQWLCGKSFPGFAPAGPFITTADEFDPENGAGIYCEVNGVHVQNGNTLNMIYSCRATVSWASRFFKLSPGDLIFTGTPGGVILGKPKDEQVWLAAGDTVEISIEGLGTLTTPLV